MYITMGDAMTYERDVTRAVKRRAPKDFNESSRE